MAAPYEKIDDNCTENPEVTKSSYYYKEEHLEIDLFQRDWDLRHRQLTCTKNPGHDNFFPVKEVTLEDMPLPIRHQEVLDYIQAVSQLVVRIRVKHTSSKRSKDDPFQTFVGRSVFRGSTGCVTKAVDINKIHDFTCEEESCMLQSYKHSVYGFVEIHANRHVLFDDSEAKSAEVDFFYDSPDNKMSVLTLKGHSVKSDSSNEESVILRCVTHDVGFIHKMGRFLEKAHEAGAAIPRSVKDCSMTDYAIVISHPHGSAKVVSFGRLIEYRKTPDRPGSALKRLLRHVSGKQRLRLRVTNYDTPTCSGCTGAPVITGYDDGWVWWAMGHSTADLNAGINMAFTV
ncbi:hypothetical protein ElyMa_005702600 [Elysia marginata]|uniref:Uncharacterized protein n=1 Tax=Elysia marginata TaxID=1093978 RepID=A0AAV4FH26_9GAST|nr:hypothetical protein ElyMa_005702600 [Elysia marginata]